MPTDQYHQHDHSTSHATGEVACEACIEAWAHAPEREIPRPDAVVLRGQRARAQSKALLDEVLADDPTTAAQVARAAQAHPAAAPARPAISHAHGFCSPPPSPGRHRDAIAPASVTPL